MISKEKVKGVKETAHYASVEEDDDKDLKPTITKERIIKSLKDAGLTVIIV